MAFRQWIRQPYITVFVVEDTLPGPLADDQQDSRQVEGHHEIPHKPPPRRVVARVQQPQYRGAEGGLGERACDGGRDLGEEQAEVPIIGLRGEVDGGGDVGGDDAAPSGQQDVIVPPEAGGVVLAAPEAQAEEGRGEGEQDPYRG